jgi:lipoate-protein ligase B
MLMREKECLVCRLGSVPYPEAAALQERLLEKRARGSIGDTVLLLEHPPTITLGRHARRENILSDAGELARLGIGVYPSTRGGDVTFHCPGQVVLYPILDMRDRPGLVRGYIHDLEEVALRVLDGYGIKAARREDHPGMWVGGRQIAALGLQLSGGISMHGMSLNVHPDLERFSIINLCGVPGLSATSIERETGRFNITVEEVGSNLLRVFAEVFKFDLRIVTRKRLFGGRVESAVAALV